MLIPVDGRDQGLPDDVVGLTSMADEVIFHDVPFLEQGDLSARFSSPPRTSDKPVDGRDESARVPKLEYWTVQAHSYALDAIARVGLLGRLFSGDAKVARAGVVHEAKRFTIQKTSENRDTEFGVAVRIYAATTDWDTKLQLTLPNLAADAQLHARDARVAIDIVGYSGPLGSLLPAPERLDVESLAVYLADFKDVQATVFGEAGLPFLTPTLLSYETNP